jgi:nucleotide-binding universal stress UspA family protein
MTHPQAQEILVALDDLRESSRALKVAVPLALRMGAAVSGVTVNSPGADHLADKRDMRLQAEHAGVVLRHSVVMSSDDVASALLAAVGRRHGATLCVGSHARGPLGQALLGSVSTEVLHRSTGPVLVVGPQAVPATECRSVLVCLDGSETAYRAVEPARAWAKQLHATPRSATVSANGRRFVPGHPSSDLTVLQDTDPAAALARFATEIDAALIVATTHGEGGLAAIGSTAFNLVRHAPCAVLFLGPSVAASARRTNSR